MPIILNGTTGEVPASWTTAGRPSSPSTGQYGYNTTLNSLEFYNGTAWVPNNSLLLASVKTSDFAAVAGNTYPVNTTSAPVTVTLPASPSAGQIINIIDYAGTAGTNRITIARNGNKIGGVAANTFVNQAFASITLTYVDSTQGWLINSSFVQTSYNQTYTASYLSVAGGGGGGGRNSGGAGGAGGLLSGNLTLQIATTYTITVGASGAGATTSITAGTSGNNSSISGSNIATVTSIGGGGGGSENVAAKTGGSGGGGGFSTTGAAGTAGQGNAGGNGLITTAASGGGGGGASAAGSNSTTGVGGAGGAGTASSITGSSVTYAGGGGGGGDNTPGTAGSGGGGTGNGGAGTANRGGGGGGSGNQAGNVGGNGGSGVVILSVPTTNYSGTTTGSPTVTTSGSNTILTFTASGTYTA